MSNQSVRTVTFRIQHSGNVKIFLCDVKGQIEIFQWVVLKYLFVCQVSKRKINMILIGDVTRGKNPRLSHLLKYFEHLYEIFLSI